MLALNQQEVGPDVPNRENVCGAPSSTLECKGIRQRSWREAGCVEG